MTGNHHNLQMRTADLEEKNLDILFDLLQREASRESLPKPDTNFADSETHDAGGQHG
jgi:hypothetical protein